MRLFLVFIFSIILLYANHSIKVGFIKNIPPYTIDIDNGIEIEIVQEAFKTQNYHTKNVFYSFKRGKKSVVNGEVEAMATMTDLGEEDLYYSKEYIEYENYAFSLEKNHIVLNNLQDLTKYSIISWQDSHNVLGQDYYNLFNNDVRSDYIKHYREMVDQEQQNKLFWANRVNIIILDINIFNYYKKLLSKDVDTSQKYIVHKVIIIPTKYKVAFRDKKLRDDFDKGLKIIKENGTYEKILQKYK